MKIRVVIDIPDKIVGDRAEEDILEYLENGQVAIDEAWLTRWDEDDSYFVFERGPDNEA